MLEKNCRFTPLKQKLGQLKRHCGNMGELMAALVKYVDSDGTKDPESDDEKPGKGKKSDNTKGHHHDPASQGANGKRKADTSLDFVGNDNTQNYNQHRKGRPTQSGGGEVNLEVVMNQPCPRHRTKERPSKHLWKDCFIMKQFKESHLFQHGHVPNGGSGSSSQGPGYGGGGSNSGF